MGFPRVVIIFIDTALLQRYQMTHSVSRHEDALLLTSRLPSLKSNLEYDPDSAKPKMTEILINSEACGMFGYKNKKKTGLFWTKPTYRWIHPSVLDMRTLCLQHMIRSKCVCSSSVP